MRINNSGGCQTFGMWLSNRIAVVGRLSLGPNVSQGRRAGRNMSAQMVRSIARANRDNPDTTGTSARLLVQMHQSRPKCTQCVSIRSPKCPATPEARPPKRLVRPEARRPWATIIRCARPQRGQAGGRPPAPLKNHPTQRSKVASDLIFAVADRALPRTHQMRRGVSSRGSTRAARTSQGRARVVGRVAAR